MIVKKHAHFEIRNGISRDAPAVRAEAFSCAYRPDEGVLEVRAPRPKSSDLCGVGEKWRKTRRVSLLQRAFRGARQKLISAVPLQPDFTGRCE